MKVGIIMIDGKIEGKKRANCASNAKPPRGRRSDMECSVFKLFVGLCVCPLVVLRVSTFLCSGQIGH